MASRYGTQLELPAQLRPFLLPNVTTTGRILGQGAYGSVVELEINGRPFAGKKIHDTLLSEGIGGMIERFYKECILLSELRDPQIVLFVGICLLPDSRLPTVVMEKLQDNLHNYLDTTPNIPLSRKLSILHDLASGLVYLHTLTPAVIHGDLTSRNVLFDETMTAKIAGFGSSQRVNEMELTMLPGALPYMPPEASTQHYSISLDIFSFGHLSLFVAIQEFPVNLLSKRFESSGRLISQSELERRYEYIQTLVSNLGKDHALVGLIQQCLQDEPAKRPTAREALYRLGNMKTTLPRQSLEKDEELTEEVEMQNTESTVTPDHPPLPERDMEAVQEKDDIVNIKEQDIAALLTDEAVRKLYEEAMTKGYIECALALLILVGVMGSGKSLFKRLVLGLPVPKFSPSTPLAESSVRSMSVCQVAVGGEGPVKWRIVTPSDMVDIVAEACKNNTVLHPDLAMDISQLAFTLGTAFDELGVENSKKAELTQQNQQRPSGTLIPQQISRHEQGSSEVTRKMELKCEESLPIVPLSTKFSDALKGINISKELMRRMSVSSGGMKLMDINFFYILDSGGQPPFREMLPHFVYKSSAFLLMQKLNERLDFKPPLRYREEGKEDSVQYASQLTNEQILHQYFQAVQSHNARLFVVGTHRDLENECEMESREEKNKRLLEAFRPVLGNRLALYKAGDPDQLMFPVDNTSRKPEDLATARAFREAVMKLCLGKKVKIPLPWFLLEQLLQQLAEKMQEKVLNIEECYEIAYIFLHMPRNACKAAIEFLGKLNILFYRPSVLEQVVFCDAQVILDKITELVRCSHELKSNTTQSLPQNRQSGEWLKFRDFAQIDANILGEFPSHYRDGLFSIPEFLELLEDLLIAGKLENGKHFMPSVLPDLALEKVADFRAILAKHPSPMAIYYTIKYSRIWLPVGVVPSLIVYLQNHYKWKPTLRGGKPACMYHNCMQFELPGGKAGSVTLIDSTKFLEIHVKALPKVASKVCPCIRAMVLSGLEEAHKSLHYDSAVVEDGVLCSGECGNKEAHLATLDEDRESWKCSEDTDIGDDLDKERQALWFAPLEDVPAKADTHSYSRGRSSLEVHSGGDNSHTEKRSCASAGPSLLPSKPTNRKVCSPLPPDKQLRPAPVLACDDLIDVKREVVDVTARWKDLGLALRLDHAQLDVVEGENRKMEDCLTQVLSLWLKKTYDCERFGEPSWELLARAVGDPVGGNNPSLAEKIVRKHC